GLACPPTPAARHVRVRGCRFVPPPRRTPPTPPPCGSPCRLLLLRWRSRPQPRPPPRPLPLPPVRSASGRFVPPSGAPGPKRCSAPAWHCQPRRRDNTSAASTNSVFRSTTCSALYARCVVPSFILAMRLSGSVGDFQSSLDTFLSL